MLTGPVGPVEVFFYWPEAVFGDFYWPGAIGSPLASSPGLLHHFLPTLIRILKRTEVFNQKVLRKPSLCLHCENLRILATKLAWNM